jgi:hypothetical protein
MAGQQKWRRAEKDIICASICRKARFGLGCGGLAVRQGRHKGVGLCRRDEHRRYWRPSLSQPELPRWRATSRRPICRFFRCGTPLGGADPAGACTPDSFIIENCGPPTGFALIRATTTRRSRITITAQCAPIRGIGYRPLRYPDPFFAPALFSAIFPREIQIPAF